MHAAVALLIFSVLLEGWLSVSYVSSINSHATLRDRNARLGWAAFPSMLAFGAAMVSNNELGRVTNLSWIWTALITGGAWVAAASLPILRHNYYVPAPGFEPPSETEPARRVPPRSRAR